MSIGFGFIIKFGFILGKLVGVYLVVSGVSIVVENFFCLLGDDEYIGVMEKGYRVIVKFMGFELKVGLMVYYVVDMVLLLYGVVVLSLKFDVLWLFRYIFSDYYRNIIKMS